MSDGEIQVGSTLWRFDENRRRYERDEKGHATGGPIWREHWVEETVVGETSRSWLVRCSAWSELKLPKAAFRDGKCPHGWARSQAEIDKLAWVEEHRPRILQKMSYGHIGYEALVKVAEAIGYEAIPMKEE